ncbi:putative phospholipid-transporting ATPase DNF3 [Cladobotryum mycophilum]|uniref:Phospholipid-transporting ATPase n=1 Tax=Cladobotryum mycophilum TaxID=491253 RepID=A0ABR0SQC3_9HYPO
MAHHATPEIPLSRSRSRSSVRNDNDHQDYVGQVHLDEGTQWDEDVTVGRAYELTPPPATNSRRTSPRRWPTDPGGSSGLPVDRLLRSSTGRSLAYHQSAGTQIDHEEGQNVQSEGAVMRQKPLGTLLAGMVSMATVDTKMSAASDKDPASARNIATTLKIKRRAHKPLWIDGSNEYIATAYRKIVIEGILRRKPLPPSADGRHVPLNPPEAGPHGLIDERTKKPYISNLIRSNRYTIYDFLPRQLFFQFSKLGNFYFLVMGILQAIPGLSTVGQWTTIAPLAIFIAFSMASEGYQDNRRYRLDRSENLSMTKVFRHGIREGKEPPRITGLASLNRKRTTEMEAAVDAASQELEDAALAGFGGAKDWMPLQWKDVRVGDVVRLKRDEAVPADMILLHATGPNGIAHIETMALDGETNLKPKHACTLLAERCGTIDGLRATRATVVSEDPNTDLYSYDGRAIVDGETVPLTLGNIVYRGSTLRNTAIAIGLVINSGEECKIRLNAQRDVRTKKPAMQTPINMMILIQILMVILLAIGLTIGYYQWEDDVGNRSFYLVRKGLYDGSVQFKQIFVGYLIMFNTLIPLSLYISLEIVKLGQLFLLHDPDMYDPVSDTPLVANTTGILENLGQISHVFSDKTGTLTENMMRFRKLSVAGVACLHDLDIQKEAQAQKGKMREEHTVSKKEKQGLQPQTTLEALVEQGSETINGSDLLERPGILSRVSTTSVSQWKSSANPQDNIDTLKTEDLLDYIRRKPNTTFSRKAKHFLLCLALCHTCLPEVRDNGETTYQAASPDELALVEAARDMGFMVIDRPAQSIKLQIQDADGTLQTETYQVLDVIEFNSQRKRMSIIIRMPDGRICLFCKGADNVITSRLRLSQVAEQKARDVSRRASVRKTFEQDKAIHRISTHINMSSPRNSLTMTRASSDRLEGLRRSIGRRSAELNRRSQAEGIASWLQRRQTEEMPSPRTSADMLRSPRMSLGRVPSFEGDHDDDNRIDETVAADEGAVFEKCFQHVDDFATDGLRTLLYAYRYLDEDTYTNWKQIYREAETSLVDRQDRIEAAGEMIEEQFELAGATAIEDRLQKGVPETIDKLRRANIKVWMLTGDKRETAINIAQSARVCKPFSELYILDFNQGSLFDSLTATLNDVGRGMVPHSVLVVDGQTLANIDADDQLTLLFYDLIIRVDSVICCRASPSQKANLVKSIRRYVPKSMTLAIGDGANDIAMIQASHVGIGISGREGLQAARISDYSIAQFRFLQKLLLVHGRWNYMRTGKYVLATFWKEIFFYLMQAYFQRSTGYTGTSLFHSWSLTLLNSIFTSLPVILLGIFDRDLQASTLLAVPELYTFGQQGRGFGFAMYFGWAIMAVAASVTTFYFTWAAYRLAIFDGDIFTMGSICFFVGVMFTNFKILILEFHSKTIIPFGGLFLSILAWFIWNLSISSAWTLALSSVSVRDGFIHRFGHTLLWWTTLLLTFSTPIIMELVVQSVRRVFWPTDVDLMQRIEKDANSKKVLRECARGEDFEGLGTEGDDCIEMEDMRPVEATPTGLSVPDTSAMGAGSRSPISPGPRVSFHEQQQARRSVRLSHDDYRPPNFTPPAEERENPFEAVKGRAP